MAPDPKKDKKGKQAPKKGLGINTASFRKWHGGVLLIIAALGGVAAYYFMVYQAGQLKVDEIIADIERKEGQLRTIKTITEEKEKTLALISEKAANLEHLEKSLPDYKFIPEFLTQIEQLTLGYNLKTWRFEPKDQPVAAPAPPPPSGDPGAPPPPADGAPAAPAEGQPPAAAPPPGFNPTSEFAAQSIDMEINGDYNDMIQFMQELAVFPKVVVVDKISIKVRDEDFAFDQNEFNKETESTLDFLMSFQFYSKKEGVQPGGGAPGAAPAPAPVSASIGLRKTASRLVPKGVRKL